MSTYSVGLRNAGSYLVSGQPYITGSSVNAGDEVKIEFPYVAKNIKIRIPSPPNTALDNLAPPSDQRLRTAPGDANGLTPGQFTFGGADMTLAWWFKVTGGGNHILHFTKGGGPAIRMIQQATTPARYTLNGAGVTTTGVRNEGEWHHAVITQLTGNIHFYLDGNLSVAAGSLPDFDDLIFWPNTTPKEFGVWDEVTVWDVGFTDSDYTELYNNGEWYNPTTHNKIDNLLTWLTMGDDSRDRLTFGVGEPSVASKNQVATNMGLSLFGYGTAGVFASGPFDSQTKGALRVSLLSTGSTSGANIVSKNHYRELQGYGTSIELPMKAKEIYLQGVKSQVTFEVIAELTNIPAERMYAITGSGIDE